MKNLRDIFWLFPDFPVREFYKLIVEFDLPPFVYFIA